MKLKLIATLFMGLFLFFNTAKAQDAESKKVFVNLYMTIVYGRASLIGDKFKSIQGDLVKSENGKSFYSVTNISSKVLKDQYLIDKGNGKRVFMGIIKKEYKDAVLEYISDWEKTSKVKNSVEDNNGDTIYSLKDSGGALFNIMIYKDPAQDIYISAYPI